MFDERLKAGTGLKEIGAINLMMTDWDEKKRVIDFIGVSDLTSSFKSGPRQMKPFMAELAKMYKQLTDDYENFVVNIAPEGDNTTLAVALRYQFTVYKYALERIILSSSKFVQLERPFTSEDNTNFKKMMLLPDNNKLEVLADIPHVLFTELAVRQHLLRLKPSPTRPRPSTFEASEDMMSAAYKPPPITIVYNAPGLDEFMKLCASYASLPIIPPDVMGNLVTTNGFDDYVELKLHEPGVDSRRNVIAPSDKRVCVVCKLDSLIVGFTDTIEQDKSVVCQCVSIKQPESSSFLDELTFTKATQSVRLLMLKGLARNQSLLSKNFDEFLRVVTLTKIGKE